MSTLSKLDEYLGGTKGKDAPGLYIAALIFSFFAFIAAIIVFLN